MTDKIEDGVEDNVETSAPQMSATEQEARESGWVPKEEFTDDPEKWVDAGEFIRRGTLFKKIDSQSREIKAMRQAIADIQALHEKSRQAEYDRALKTIREEKKAALEEGDADAVIEADEKLDMLREAQREDAQQKPKVQETGEEHPEFVNWVNKNTWYKSHTGMKAFADAIGTELQGQGLTPSEVLKRVEEEVRKEFPNRFKNPNQEKPNAVEGSGSPRGVKGKDEYVLSDQERSIMNNLVRLKVMTKEQYIDELRKVTGV